MLGIPTALQALPKSVQRTFERDYSEYSYVGRPKASRYVTAGYAIALSAYFARRRKWKSPAHLEEHRHGRAPG
jgi:hypothetical protein